MASSTAWCRPCPAPKASRFWMNFVPSCYAVWSQDRAGRLSAEPATAFFEPPGSPEPPTKLRATLNLSHLLGDTGISVRWRNAETETLRSVWIVRTKDRCSTRPPERPLPWEARGADPGSAEEYHDFNFYPGSDARRYCYSIWSRDRFGRLSRPASVWSRPPARDDQVPADTLPGSAP